MNEQLNGVEVSLGGILYDENIYINEEVGWDAMQMELNMYNLEIELSRKEFETYNYLINDFIR